MKQIGLRIFWVICFLITTPILAMDEKLHIAVICSTDASFSKDITGLHRYPIGDPLSPLPGTRCYVYAKFEDQNKETAIQSMQSAYNLLFKPTGSTQAKPTPAAKGKK